MECLWHQANTIIAGCAAVACAPSTKNPNKWQSRCQNRQTICFLCLYLNSQSDYRVRPKEKYKNLVRCTDCSRPYLSPIARCSYPKYDAHTLKSELQKRPSPFTQRTKFTWKAENVAARPPLFLLFLFYKM